MSAVLSADEYRALVDASPVMIWRAAVDARCDYFNDTWLAFTGRTLDDELGDGWMDDVHPDDLDRVTARYHEHFHRRVPFDIEYRLRRHDGVYRWIVDRGVPFEHDGAFAGYIGSCIDIDERRTAEANRRATLAMVAHELRTPLAALQTYLDVIQASASPDPVVFDKVARQVRRFSKLVDDLGDTARVESGQPLSVTKIPIDLGELVRRVATTYEDLVRQRTPRIQFEATLEAGRFPMLGDPERIEQVLTSLLENALKFSSGGGKVTLSLARDAAGARVQIVDRGVGIPIEELSAVTRPYARASSATTARYAGIGMGLAIANELVALHGGRLRITSELGKGTDVTVLWPGGP